MTISTPNISSEYKQTEVGVIPMDWDISLLGSCLLKPPRYGIGAAAVEYSDKLPQYIRITDISEDCHYSPENKVSVNHHSAANYFLFEGDIVVARTGASVGKSYLYRSIDGQLVFAGFLICLTPDRSILSPGYLSFYLQTSSYWNWVRLTSMRSGQPGINGNEYAQLLIPLPKLKEQKAIATMLSDIDSLIEKLENLIDKKKNIKQGAMQELLTGKRRLAGFSNKWEAKKLGEVGKCLRGVSYNGERDLHPVDTDITVRLLRSNNIQDKTIEFNDLQFVDNKRVKPIQILQENDIVICMANGSKQLVGKSAIFRIKDSYKYTFGAFMGCFRTDSSLANSYFISFCFQTFQYRSFIDILLSGSSINNLRPSDIESIEINIPKQREEQAAITNILSDMDAEIDKLESQLTKYHSIKQGMMQTLLTGKIRLI